MELLSRLAGGPGHRVAYVDTDLGEVTYDELRRAVRRYAADLRARDLPPGTRALVVADDSVATVVAVLGLWANRHVPVPVSPLLTDAELTFIAHDCGAGCVHLDGPAARQNALEALFPAVPQWTGDRTRALIRSGAGHEPAHPEAEPLAWDTDREVLVQYTSGSTGVPKGVLHGRSGIEAVLAGFGADLGLGPDDRVLSTAKLSFGYGFGNSLLFPLAAGAATILMRGPVDPHRLSMTLTEGRPTVLCSVPRMYHALVALAARGGAPDLGTLRLAVSAGEHLPADLQAKFEDGYGVPLVNGLGATEVLHIVVATRPQGTERGSTGWPVTGVTATVRDAGGAEVSDGEEGRLHIAGPSVALGYLARPEQTSRTFADRGAYTGDVVRRGPAGDIRYVCRADDLLNLGGYKVSPLEIEAVVRGVPGVADCAVVGRTDEAGLQQAVTYVVPTAGTDPAGVRTAVLAAFRSQLAPFKRPSQVEVLDALPTTSTGKLARFKLRDADPPVPPAQVTTSVRNPGGDRTLACLPFAGGTAQAFARMTRCLPASWSVVTGETSYRAGTTLTAAAEAWWRAIRAHLSPGGLVFGHSLGAAVAAEIGHRFGDRLAGVHLVVSAPPLRLPDTLLAPAADSDPERLVGSLADAGLLPGRELSSDELRRLVVPRFVADLQILRDGWRFEPPTVPVHVLVGSDDPTCTPEDVKGLLRGWDLTAVHVIEGGHYFCVDNPEQTADTLQEIART